MPTIKDYMDNLRQSGSTLTTGYTPLQNVMDSLGQSSLKSLTTERHSANAQLNQAIIDASKKRKSLESMYNVPESTAAFEKKFAYESRLKNNMRNPQGIQPETTKLQEFKTGFTNVYKNIGAKLGIGTTSAALGINPMAIMDSVFAIESTVTSAIVNTASKLVGSDYRMQPKTYTKAVTDVAQSFGVDPVDVSKIKNKDIQGIATDINNGTNIFYGMKQRADAIYEKTELETRDKVGKAVKIAGDVIQAVPQMAVMLLPGGELTYAVSAYNNAIMSATDKGIVSNKKFEQNLYNASVDVATEMIFGLFDSSHSIVGKALSDSAKKTIKPTVAQTIYGVLKQAGEEGAEEMIAYPFQLLVDWRYENPDKPITDYLNWQTAKDWGYAGLVGFIAGGAMVSANTVANYKLSQNEKNKLNNTIQTVLQTPTEEITVEQLQTIVDLTAKGTKPENGQEYKTVQQTINESEQPLATTTMPLQGATSTVEGVPTQNAGKYVPKTESVPTGTQAVTNKSGIVQDSVGNNLTLYHGTTSSFKDFSAELLGVKTGAESASKGFFFTDNEIIAKTYADKSYDTLTKIKNLQREVSNETGMDYNLAINKWARGKNFNKTTNKKIEKLSKLKQDIEIKTDDYFGKLETTGDVKQVNLEMKNPFVIDARGKQSTEIGISKIIDRAKAGRFDGVIIKNVIDSYHPTVSETSTVYIVFDKNQIKNVIPKPIKNIRTIDKSIDKSIDKTLKTAQKASKTKDNVQEVKQPTTKSEKISEEKLTVSLDSIYEKSKTKKNVEQDLDKWFKTDEAKDITKLKTEEDFINKLTSLEQEAKQKGVTKEKLLKVNLQLFAMKSWEQRVNAHHKNKNISLYMRNMIDALMSESTVEVQNKLNSFVKTEELFHEILGGDKTVKTGTKTFNDGDMNVLSALELKYSQGNAELLPSDVVAIDLFARKLMASGKVEDIVRVEKLVANLSRHMTKAGQFTQSAILLKRLFPEYKSRKVIKEIESTIKPDDKRVLDDVTKEAENTIDKMHKDAAGKTIEDLKKPVERKDKTKEQTNAERLLAKVIHEARIMSQPDAPKVEPTKYNVERRMVYELFQKFKDRVQPKAPPTTEEDVIQKRENFFEMVEAITVNRQLFRDVWNEAQALGEKRTEIQDTAFYQFLELNTDPVIADSIMRKSIAETLKQNDISMASFSKEYYLKEHDAVQAFMSMFEKNIPNLDEQSKEYLVSHVQQIFRKHMDELRESAKARFRKMAESRKTWKKGVETQESIIAKLMDVAYKDSFSVAEVRELWAKRMGLTVISAEMEKDIYQTMRDIAAQHNPDKANAMYDALVDRIASSITSTPYEKAVAIIRFSLLLNPSTLISNMTSNLAAMPLYRLTDVVENLIQKKVVKVDKSDWIMGGVHSKLDNTTDVGRAVIEHANNDAIERYLKKTEKYSLGQLLGREKKVFKNAKVEKMMKIPFRAMNEGQLGRIKVPFLGDVATFSIHFKIAMANSLDAQGYKESLDDVVKQKMIDTAMEKANDIASTRVFREITTAASIVQSIKGSQKKLAEKYRTKEQFSKAREAEQTQGFLNKILDTMFRFLITPAAIGTEIYRFSPIAGAVALAKDFAWAKHKGTWEESQQRALFAHKFAQSLTGTGTTFVLGIVMGLLGFVDTEPPENETEKLAWELAGHRKWSVFIPGIGAFSIDWLQPFAGNIMIGASIARSIKDKGLSIETFAEIPDNLLSIFMEQSIINNITYTFGDKYATGVEKLGNFALGSAYQFLPSAVARFNKFLDPYERDMYKGSALAKFSYRILNAIPGGSYAIPVKYDIWGNKVTRVNETGALGSAERFVVNFLAPFTFKKSQQDDVTKEVTRIYNATKETSKGDALPPVPNNYFTYNKIKYTMTVAEHTQYMADVGKLCYDYAQKYISSSNYKRSTSGKEITDEQRAINLDALYSEAQKIVKNKFIKEHPEYFKKEGE